MLPSLSSPRTLPSCVPSVASTPVPTRAAYCGDTTLGESHALPLVGAAVCELFCPSFPCCYLAALFRCIPAGVAPLYGTVHTRIKLVLRGHVTRAAYLPLPVHYCWSVRAYRAVVAQWTLGTSCTSLGAALNERTVTKQLRCCHNCLHHFERPTCLLSKRPPPYFGKGHPPYFGKGHPPDFRKGPPLLSKTPPPYLIPYRSFVQ